MPDFALEVENVSKHFGGTPALNGVSLRLAHGEVHALLGHNGSGKSTLIKIIAGYHRPDEGRVVVNGHEIHYPTTALALREHGVSFMHQDIGLVPSMSVLENLRVGRMETGFAGHVKWSYEDAKVRELLGSFGVDVNPQMPVSRLSASQRAVLGLLRAFQDLGGEGRESYRGGLIVLDEPTAALPEAEKALLFGAIRRVAERGVGVLLVTHHLEEPLSHAETVSVLRDGCLVASDPVIGHSYDSLAELVMGRQVVLGSRGARNNGQSRSEVLCVDDLRGGILNGVSFCAYKGEVLGLTGLMGAGHEEVPFLIYGAEMPKQGHFLLDGVPYRPNPLNARRSGLALVSGDRLRAGGVLSATIGENMSLPVLHNIVGMLGWLKSGEEKSLVESMLQAFNVKLAASHLPFSSLSGGNQQKALVGRWVESRPRVLLLQEPTAGVDIGASQDVMGILQKFADAGGTVIFSSEQYEDVASFTDRVLVFRSGKVVSELRGDDITVEKIVTASYGRVESR